MPRKIASAKKAKPSMEKGMPMIAPANAMKRGHRSPSSKEITVPDTAPTAAKTMWKTSERPKSHRAARRSGTRRGYVLRRRAAWSLTGASPDFGLLRPEEVERGLRGSRYGGGGASDGEGAVARLPGARRGGDGGVGGAGVHRAQAARQLRRAVGAVHPDHGALQQAREGDRRAEAALRRAGGRGGGHLNRRRDS